MFMSLISGYAELLRTRTRGGGVKHRDLGSRLSIGPVMTRKFFFLGFCFALIVMGVVSGCWLKARPVESRPGCSVDFSCTRCLFLDLELNSPVTSPAGRTLGSGSFKLMELPWGSVAWKNRSRGPTPESFAALLCPNQETALPESSSVFRRFRGGVGSRSPIRSSILKEPVEFGFLTRCLHVTPRGFSVFSCSFFFFLFWHQNKVKLWMPASEMIIMLLVTIDSSCGYPIFLRQCVDQHEVEFEKRVVFFSTLYDSIDDQRAVSRYRFKKKTSGFLRVSRKFFEKYGRGQLVFLVSYCQVRLLRYEFHFFLSIFNKQKHDSTIRSCVLRYC